MRRSFRSVGLWYAPLWSNIPAGGKFTGGHQWPPLYLGGRCWTSQHVVGRGFWRSLRPPSSTGLHWSSLMKGLWGPHLSPDIRGEAAPLHVGKIDAILDGSARTLKIKEVDTYALRASPEGNLVCDVFLDPAEAGEPAVAQVLNVNGGVMPALPPDAANGNGNSAPTVAVCVVENIPAWVPGSGSDTPLAIATDRAVHNPAGRLAAPGICDLFLRFLHSLLAEHIPGLPEFGTPWPRAKYVSMLLERHVLGEKVFEFFTAWSRPIGGYVVPEGCRDYTGTAFTSNQG
ncbi:hypothetical protein B0H14DRAFT_2622285 [Mycena olivaceomarginata]|nr:hypothetical protein B0H14DRAFT_2622285 [Mycena olivaceomarginata]